MTYSIPTLLEGKLYRSNTRTREGIIQYATLREDCWRTVGVNQQAYRVQVRPHYTIGDFKQSDFYATIYVNVGA